ncbi:hypothetical protein WS47_30520 [Burkholderia territorii]|nr:hypothetical protein WS47_30520 [Burkholderia territorii]
MLRISATAAGVAVPRVCVVPGSLLRLNVKDVEETPVTVNVPLYADGDTPAMVYCALAPAASGIVPLTTTVTTPDDH